MEVQTGAYINMISIGKRRPEIVEKNSLIDEMLSLELDLVTRLEFVNIVLLNCLPIGNASELLRTFHAVHARQQGTKKRKLSSKYF